MVGVGDGPGVVAQGQPADAAVVELHELAVGLLALLLVQDEAALPRVGQPGLLAAGSRNRWRGRAAGRRRAGRWSRVCRTPRSTRIWMTCRPSRGLDQPGLHHARLVLPALSGRSRCPATRSPPRRPRAASALGGGGPVPHGPPLRTTSLPCILSLALLNYQAFSDHTHGFHGWARRRPGSARQGTGRGERTG